MTHATQGRPARAVPPSGPATPDPVPPLRTADAPQGGAVLLGIDRLLLRVASVAAAVAYYRDVLGLVVSRVDGDYATVTLPDDRDILLHNDPDLPAEAVFLRVNDVRDVYRQREALRLRFTTPPTRVSRGFRATAKDPFGSVLLIIDRSLEAVADPACRPGGPTPVAAETAKPAGTLFGSVPGRPAIARESLATLYADAGRTADDLPYTPQFEKIFEAYAAGFAGTKPTRAETWRHLLLLRKKGDLKKLGPARSRPPALELEEAGDLRALIDAAAGGLGRRDRLPYDPVFDTVAEKFNKSRVKKGRQPLSPHLLWRAVATLAK